MKKPTVSMTETEMNLGWLYFVIQLLVLPRFVVTINALLGAPMCRAEMNVLLFALNFLCLAIIFRRFLRDNAKHSFCSPLVCLRTAAIGLVLYFLLLGAVSLLIVLIYPAYTNMNNDSLKEMVRQHFLLMLVGLVFLVPFAEELLFRGLLFRQLYARSSILAYIVSAAAFSLPHVIGYLGQYTPLHLLLSFLHYIPAGLCLGWAYVKADSIFVPILMHMIINLIGIFAMR